MRAQAPKAYERGYVQPVIAEVPTMTLRAIQRPPVTRSRALTPHGPAAETMTFLSKHAQGENSRDEGAKLFVEKQ